MLTLNITLEERNLLAVPLEGTDNLHLWVIRHHLQADGAWLLCHGERERRTWSFSLPEKSTLCLSLVDADHFTTPHSTERLGEYSEEKARLELAEVTAELEEFMSTFRHELARRPPPRVMSRRERVSVCLDEEEVFGLVSKHVQTDFYLTTYEGKYEIVVWSNDKTDDGGSLTSYTHHLKTGERLSVCFSEVT